MDPITILAGIAPLGVELGKSLISKFLGQENFKPANIDDWLKMRSSDIEMFKAMNDAGGTNASYPWVEAIVRLQRPAVAVVAISVWAYASVAGISSPSIENFCAAIGFYLFGDRTLFYVRKANK